MIEQYSGDNLVEVRFHRSYVLSWILMNGNRYEGHNSDWFAFERAPTNTPILYDHDFLAHDAGSLSCPLTPGVSAVDHSRTRTTFERISPFCPLPRRAGSRTRKWSACSDTPFCWWAKSRKPVELMSDVHG